jgi:hypothetical protein
VSEKTAAIEETEDEAVASQVEESAVATDPQPSPEDTPETGAQEQESTETVEAASPPAEPAETETTETGEHPETEPEIATTGRKKRTQKQFERVIGENRQLKEQLRTMFAAGTAPQPGPQQQPLPVTSAPQVPGIEGTPEYWASQYHAEDDPVRKSEFARRYETSREKQIEDRAVARMRQEQYQRQQGELLSEELSELDSVAPIFKPNTTEIDKDSPLVKAAIAKAASRGQAINTFTDLVYWGRAAALGFVMTGGIAAKVEAKKTATKLKQTIAKSGLEGTGKGSAPKAPQDFASRMKQLKAKAESGDTNAAREYTRLQLQASLMA